MMGALSWITGVGLPGFVGLALLGAAGAAWFKVPAIGHYFGLALACVGVALIVSAASFNEARKMCNDAALRAELANARRDLSIMAQAADKASELSGKLNEAEQRNAELARQITDSCILGDDNARRLRNIR